MNQICSQVVNDRRLSPACTEHVPGPSTSGNFKLASVLSVMWSEHRKPAMDRAAALSTDGCTVQVSQTAQRCRCGAVTRRERPQVYGTRTSELIVG